MKSKGKKAVFTKVGFTIIELLTVMSIIVILISLLVPSLNAVRRYAKEVRQKGQFHDIGKGMELFSIDFDGYPDSSRLGRDNLAYCGAMKLCEAMVGQDGLGFHPDSVFRQDGYDRTVTNELYPRLGIINRRERKMPYIDVDKYKIATIEDLYSYAAVTASAFADPCETILCDVFYRNDGQVSGEQLGMPVLYYQADVSKLKHNYLFIDDPCNTYNYYDNWELMDLEVPTQAEEHPMYSIPPILTGPEIFFEKTQSKKVTAVEKAYNEGSYILISAGFDGLYGTRDDVFNFAE